MLLVIYGDKFFKTLQWSSFDFFNSIGINVFGKLELSREKIYSICKAYNYLTGIHFLSVANIS
jgi:hypothetical protein